MPKVDDHELIEHLESALAGDPRPLHSFLREHSNLPGPRGNLELAGQFADVVATRASVWARMNRDDSSAASVSATWLNAELI